MQYAHLVVRMVGAALVLINASVMIVVGTDQIAQNQFVRTRADSMSCV